MIEFVTADAKVCPYCKSELTGSNYLMIPPYDYWKECKICNKRFEIAYFNPKEITNES